MGNNYLYICRNIPAMIMATYLCSAPAKEWVISPPTIVELSESNVTHEMLKTVKDDRSKPTPTKQESPTLAVASGINTGSRYDLPGSFEGPDEYNDFFNSFKNLSLWIRPHYDKGNHNATSLFPSFSTQSSGLTFGVTNDLNQKTKMGLAITYDNTKTTNDHQHEGKINSIIGSFFSNWSDNSFFLNTLFSTGTSRIKLMNQWLNSNNPLAFNAHSTSATLNAGLHYKQKGWHIDPALALNYTRISFNSASEAEKNLKISSLDIAEMGTGIKIYRSYWGRSLIRHGRYQPEFSLMGYYEFSDSASNLITRLPVSMNDFIISSPDRGRLRLQGKIGLTISRHKELKINASYLMNKTTNYLSHGINTNIKYKF